MEAWELLLWNHLGGSCFFMRNIFLLGHILELSYKLEPQLGAVRQPQWPDWGTVRCSLFPGGLRHLVGCVVWPCPVALLCGPMNHLRKGKVTHFWGVLWDLGFSGMHTSCVFRLKALFWCHHPELYLWHLLALKHQEKMERVAVPCVTDQERQRNVSELFWVNGTIASFEDQKSCFLLELYLKKSNCHDWYWIIASYNGLSWKES